MNDQANADPTGYVSITTNGTTRLVPEEEPVFLLRGQDMLASQAVRAWAIQAERNHLDETMVRSAYEIADAMDAWPVKKMPDPPGAAPPLGSKLTPYNVMPAAKAAPTHQPSVGPMPSQAIAALQDILAFEPNVLSAVDPDRQIARYARTRAAQALADAKQEG